jgi:phosphomannomutase/phosphoglucomutase
MPLAEDKHSDFMKAFIEKITVTGGDVCDLDGLRVDYSDGWGLARPSNTSPNIVLRFEGEDEVVLERIMTEFRTVIKLILPGELTF